MGSKVLIKNRSGRVEEEGELGRPKWVGVPDPFLVGTQRPSAATLEMPVNTMIQVTRNHREMFALAVAVSFWGFCLRRTTRGSVPFALDFSQKPQQVSVVCPSWFVSDLSCDFRQTSLRFSMC